MKKNIAKIFIIAMLMFVPSTAKADIDVLSAIQDTITSYMGKVNSIVKKYVSIQLKLQELSLNRNIISQLRDQVKTQLKEQAMKFVDEFKDMAMAELTTFVKTSLSSVTLPGIGQYIDLGAFVNPKLRVAVGETYIKRQHKNSDVAYNLQKDNERNDQIIKNIAILFANSLVRRVQIIEDNPCRCVGANGELVSDMPKCTNEEKTACEKEKKELSELKDVNVVKQKYFDKITSGHHRWNRISEAYSAYKKMVSEAELGHGNVEDISEVTGVTEENKEEENTESANAINKYMQDVQKQREQNTLALQGMVTNSISQIKNGDYMGAAAGAMGAATNIYGNAPGSWSSVTKAMKETTTGLNAANDVLNNTKTGNWGGALGAAAGGAGNIIGDTGNKDLGNVFSNAATGAGNALNAGLNNNWSGVAGAVGTAAGNAVSGAGNDVLGATITTGGNLTGVGVNAADGGFNWDNINSTLDQTQSALGTAQSAYDKQNQQNAELMKAKEEADKKAKEEAEAARKAEEEAQKAAEEKAKQEKKIEDSNNEMIEYFKKECQKCKADKNKTETDCWHACSYQ